MDRLHRPQLLLLAALATAALIAIALATVSGPVAAVPDADAATKKRGPWYALQGSADPREAEIAGRLGAKLVRVEFDLRTPVSKMRETMQMYDQRNIRVLLLAGFAFRVATPREVQNLKDWAKAFGPGGELRNKPVLHIEFGNETGFAYHRTNRRGGEYARRCKQASQIIRSANRRVKILCQADDGNTGDGWIADMFKAVPNLDKYVDGWVIHPYGNTFRQKIANYVRQLKAAGASSKTPIDITEFGLASANGRTLDTNYGFPRNLTYSQASALLRRSVQSMRKQLKSRLRMVVLYRARDGAPVGATPDREEYFGFVNHLGELKGPYGQTGSTLLRSSAAP
ncbi:MAG: hypothetical protein JHC84_04505 [Solirubrobacteraceae bacterium]|nr:hypothetical protein [Solirubrobacteraceae bacterium]